MSRSPRTGGGRAQDPVDRALVEAAGRASLGRGIAPLPVRPAPQARERRVARRRQRVGRRQGRAGVRHRGLHDVRRRSGTSSSRRSSGSRYDGLRVIAVAERHVAGVPARRRRRRADLSFLGLIAFRDPLRDGVPDAVAQLADAGVRTIVVSGDHPRRSRRPPARPGCTTSSCCSAAPGSSARRRRARGQLRGEPLSSHAPLLRTSSASSRSSSDRGRGRRRHRRRRQRRAGARGGQRRDRDGRAGNRPRPRGRRPGARRRRVPDDRRRGRGRSRAGVPAAARGRVLPRREGRSRRRHRAAVGGGAAVPVPPGADRRAGAVHGCRRIRGLRLRAHRAGDDGSPPRDPASRFLDGTQLSATALTARRSPLPCSRRFSSSTPRSGTDMAIAAAMAGWLIAHAAIAWTLRARPGLPLHATSRSRCGRSSRSPPRLLRSPRPARCWASSRSRRAPWHHGRRRGDGCGDRGRWTRRAVAVAAPMTAPQVSADRRRGVRCPG